MPNCPDCNKPLEELRQEGSTTSTVYYCEDCEYTEPGPSEGTKFLQKTSAWIQDGDHLDKQTKERLQEVIDNTKTKLALFTSVIAERKVGDVAKFLSLSDKVWEELFKPGRIALANNRDLIALAQLVQNKMKDDTEFIQKVASSGGIGAGAEGVLNKAVVQEDLAKEKVAEIPAHRREMMRKGFEKLLRTTLHAPKQG